MPERRENDAEIYVSTDIECDGLIPGLHSMLSLGSAAYFTTGELIATYSANLEPLADCEPLPQTMEWWRSFPEAWAKCRENPRQAEEVMPEYAAWAKALPGRPVFIGYPVAFDFAFVSYYLARFAQQGPFGFAALDIKSYAMALTKGTYFGSSKESLPPAWRGKTRHTHVALDDAMEQGELFCNMLAANRAENSAP